jgi:hypothetical protein
MTTDTNSSAHKVGDVQTACPVWTDLQAGLPPTVIREPDGIDPDVLGRVPTVHNTSRPFGLSPGSTRGDPHRVPLAVLLHGGCSA